MFWIKKKNQKYASFYQLSYRIKHIIFCNQAVLIYHIYDPTDNKFFVVTGPYNQIILLTLIIYKYIICNLLTI